MAKKITPRQEQFALKFFECSNASEAYRYAYKADNMKDETIWREAHNVLKNPNVATMVEELREEAKEKAKVTHEMITEELKRMAFFDIRKLYDEYGNLKNANDLDDVSASVVSGIKERVEKTEDGNINKIVEYKLNDKGQSLEKLAKHLGYYEKDNKQKEVNVIVKREKYKKRKAEILKDIDV
jgi:phage terminase small subunit